MNATVNSLLDALNIATDKIQQREDFVCALSDQVEALTKERDALAASRYAYATEFSLDEECQPDVGSIHQNIRALKAAAKLALDALHTASHYTSALPEYHLSDFEVNEAIAALRQVDVQ